MVGWMPATNLLLLLTHSATIPAPKRSTLSKRSTLLLTTSRTQQHKRLTLLKATNSNTFNNMPDGSPTRYTQNNNIPSPDNVVQYPISGDDTGGTLFLFSGQDGNRTTGTPPPSSDTSYSHVILFCAGFPDDHNVLSPFAARLAKELKGDVSHSKNPVNVLCGVTCLPGYDDLPPEKPWTRHPKEGYTIDQWATSLRAAAKALKEQAAGASSSTTNQNFYFTTIFHDWAVVPGTIYVNRALADDEEDAAASRSRGEEKDSNTLAGIATTTTATTKIAPDQMIFFDIFPLSAHRQQSPRPPREVLSLQHIARENLYRIIFALGYILHRYVSKFVALPVIGFLLAILSLLGLTPTLPLDNVLFEEHFKKDFGRCLYIMFPYYNVFQIIAQGKSRIRQVFGQYHLPLLEKVPLLYLYGLEKKVQFHDASLVAYVKEFGTLSKTKTDCIGVENAGHWLYVQQEDVCIEAVKKFLLAEQ